MLNQFSFQFFHSIVRDKSSIASRFTNGLFFPPFGTPVFMLIVTVTKGEEASARVKQIGLLKSGIQINPGGTTDGRGDD